MAGGRQGSRTRAPGTVERGALGGGMMSDVDEKGMDITKSPSAAEQGAEAGSDLREELEKIDRDDLKR
jgi:hypothetical protein